MADISSDIQRWLLNAEDAVGVDNKAGQITWLREQRKSYAAKAGDLDWEITQDSADGATTQGNRGTTNRAEHDAIVGAIRKLEGRSNRGDVLSFRISNITG